MGAVIRTTPSSKYIPIEVFFFFFQDLILLVLGELDNNKCEIPLLFFGRYGSTYICTKYNTCTTTMPPYVGRETGRLQYPYILHMPPQKACVRGESHLFLNRDGCGRDSWRKVLLHMYCTYKGQEKEGGENARL